MRNLSAFVSIVIAAFSVDARAAVVCPGASTVSGVDVSHYQGSVDWAQVKASGRAFAVASVGDGTYEDPDFAANWSGMKAAGLIRGAYQFFEPGDDPTTIANIVVSKVGKLGEGDLPVMLDVEVTGGQSAATIASRIGTWLSVVKNGTGKTPIIYTGKYFWDDNVASSAYSGYALWIAAYGVTCPDTPSAWSGWKFWQDTDAASVSGISGGVDGDLFDGTLAELQVFAGGADWAASYVSQSWPLASTAMHLVTNQKTAASITMKNTGTKTWDKNTRLGTSEPRDRKSVFVYSDWLAPNRADAVSGTVAPGADYKFAFTFHAPMTPGTYYEHFNLVQEGVAWFSDPGQGGPADDDIEAYIIVDQADYAAELSKSSFSGPISLAVGGTIDGWVELKNVGKDAWKAGVVKLAPIPRDQDSPLAAPSWLSPTRAATVAADVQPGDVGHFDFTLEGSAQVSMTAKFGLVAEGITWFADAPAGGGPDDGTIAFSVKVGDGSAGDPDGDDPGTSGGVGSGGSGSGDDGSGAMGGAASGGCSLTARATSPSLLVCFLVLGFVVRRRLRRA